MFIFEWVSDYLIQLSCDIEHDSWMNWLYRERQCL